MANNVLSSRNIIISIKVASTFVPIKGVTAFDGLHSGAASIIDVTDLDSTRKEKQMGIPDEGNISLDVNYIATDPGQLAVEAARNAAVPSEFKIAVPTKTWTFSALVPTFSKGAGVDKVWAGKIALEITGAVTEAIVTP